jgi:hypothetical protein
VKRRLAACGTRGFLYGLKKMGFHLSLAQNFTAGMDAGCNGFISFLQSKKLTAQKWHGCHF